MEIQVALNTAAFKSGQYGYVRAELDALVAAADTRSCFSVILQTPLLSEAETAAAGMMLCAACGVSLCRAHSRFW